jgi:hypothetical protein
MKVFRSAKTRSDRQRTPRPFAGALGMAIGLALAIPSLAQALSFQVGTNWGSANWQHSDDVSRSRPDVSTESS